MIYVEIDGKWHVEVQQPDGPITTECGIDALEIPYHADWTHDVPVDDLCPKCFPKRKKAA